MTHWIIGAGLVLAVAGVFQTLGRRGQEGVTIDDEGIRRRAGSLREAVRWEELERILIVTTDEGPLAEDVYWLFAARDGTGCAVPGSAVGDALFERLKRLEGVDYAAICAAMGSTDDASFEIWRASDASTRT